MYGFKLYYANLKKDRGRLPFNLITSEFSFSNHAIDCINLLQEIESSNNHCPWNTDYQVRELLNIAEGKETLQYKEAGSIGRIEYSNNSNYILFKSRIGRINSHESAIKPETDIDLHQSAPSNEYRCLLIPRRHSNSLFAVESIGRSCPSKKIVTLLALGSALKKRNSDKENPSSMWRLEINQIGDSELLEEIIKNGDAEIILQRERKGREGDRTRKDIKIIAKVSKGRMSDLIGSLREGLRSLDHPIDLLQFIEDSEPLKHLDLSEGQVNLSADSVSTRLKLGEEFKDMFTYRISDERPSDELWVKSVLNRLHKIDDTLVSDFHNYDNNV